MDPRFIRLLAGFAAGAMTVFLVDRFLLPGTLSAGLIGVACALAVLSFMTRKA